MRIREQHSYNYLLFRHPTEYVLILLPLFVGIIYNIFFEESRIISEFDPSVITQYQYDMIDNYLLYSKLTIVILISFFISYRWTSMQNDGSFGFWLTLGISRSRFYFLTVTKTLFIFYVSDVLGLISIIYINGLQFEPDVLILLNLLVLLNLLGIIGTAILISSVIPNPELASLSFLLLMMTNIILNTNYSSIFHQILNSDLHYAVDSGISLVLAGITALVINILSYRILISMDMEI